MNSQVFSRNDLVQLPKPFRHLYSSKTLRLPNSSATFSLTGCKRGFRAINQSYNGASLILKPRNLGIFACSASASSSNSVAVSENSEEDAESAQIFEKLKDAERQRINKFEELENEANTQLERQLVMTSYWSRVLLTMHGKFKGTEWDPENSDRIDFSNFWRLLNSNEVRFMEYSNYGQAVSVILPYHKDEKIGGSEGNSKKEIVFRHHIVDRMPIDSWNDVWQKLHQQIVNVNVLNVDTVPVEVYSTVATAVIWSMRLALSIGLYIWIDNLMRRIYAKLIPCDLGTPSKKKKGSHYHSSARRLDH